MALFADQDIPKGTVTWQFMPGYDLLLTQAEIDALPEPGRSNLLDHTYLTQQAASYVLCADNARFMNHADEPNTAGVHEKGAIEGYDVATRDIKSGRRAHLRLSRVRRRRRHQTGRRLIGHRRELFAGNDDRCGSQPFATHAAVWR